jgi:hypothetical protein
MLFDLIMPVIVGSELLHLLEGSGRLEGMSVVPSASADQGAALTPALRSLGQSSRPGAEASSPLERT